MIGDGCVVAAAATAGSSHDPDAGAAGGAELDAGCEGRLEGIDTGVRDRGGRGVEGGPCPICVLLAGIGGRDDGPGACPMRVVAAGTLEGGDPPLAGG